MARAHSQPVLDLMGDAADWRVDQMVRLKFPPGIDPSTVPQKAGDER
jgi:hypothetical protein